MKIKIAVIAIALSLSAALLAFEAYKAPANSLPAMAFTAKKDGPFPLCPPYCSPEERKSFFDRLTSWR